jgi:hypothetical protein
MSEIRASLHWQEQKGRGTNMSLFGDLVVVEEWFHSVRDTYYKAWIEKAVFPQYVTAITSGYLREVYGLEAKPRYHRRKGMETEKSGEIIKNGDVIAIARCISHPEFVRPFWEVDYQGRTFQSGCLEGLLLEISDFERKH